MTKRIACVGHLTDTTFAYAFEGFSRRASKPPIIVDLSVSGSGFWGHYKEGSAECRVRSGLIDVRLDRDEVALYHRLLPTFQTIRCGTDRWRGHRIAHYFFERLLDTRFFKRIINPWMAGWSNGTRPIHYRFLASVGFLVPPWIISNDPEEVQDFLAQNNAEVFVKSVSFHRTISTRFSEYHSRDLQRLLNCPALFQKAVPGADVRVHVVKSNCFGVKIASNCDDYRYPGNGVVHYSAVDVPEAIARLSVDATRQLGLVFSGIDFKICQRSGEWYCLEINPMPGYSFYDSHLDGRITAALASYLEGSDCR